MDQIFGEMLMWDQKKETRKMLTEADLEETALEKSFVAAPCIREFGLHVHTDEHEQADCMATLDAMDYGDYDYPEYDAQTAHFERWGRPAFPNEY